MKNFLRPQIQSKLYSGFNFKTLVLTFFSLIVSFSITKIYSQNATITATGNWTVPAGVTSITVEAWGGGGGGGGVTGNPAGGGGGAGGAYTRKVFAVTPGQVIPVTIGVAGAAGANTGTNGGNGGNTIFNSAALMLAQGGSGGIGGTGNTSYSGGLASLSASVGDLVRAGGNGGTGASGTTAGGGGQGGGFSANGNNGGANTFGRGTNGTYDANFDGGDGGTVSTGGTGGAGGNGAAPGGGGGGGRAANGTDRAGGSGGRGEIRIHWCTAAPVVPNLTFNEGSDINVVTICPGTQVGGGNENDIEVTPSSTGTSYINDGCTYLWEASLDGGSTWGPAINGFLPTTGSIGTAQTYGNPYYNTYPQYPIYSYYNATGVYRFRLKVSNACGTSVSTPTDNIVITVAGPVASANTNTIPDNICNNQTLTLSNSSFGGGATSAAWSIVSGGGSLSSTALTTNPSAIVYTPASGYSGPVLLRLTTNPVNDPTCGTTAVTAYSDRNINVGGTPVITQPADITASCPNNVVNFPAPTISGNPTTITFTPTSGTNFNIGTNVVTLNASNACGPAVPKTFNVTINGPGTVPTFTGLTTSVCSGGSVSALPTTSNNGITGSWSPSAISNTTGGTYVFTPSVGLCAEGYTLNVTVNPAPTATISYAGTPYCIDATDPSPTLIGTGGGIYSSTSGLTINASTGVIDLSAGPTGVNNVTYTIAAAGGCPVVVATTSVTINPLPVVSAGTYGPVCIDAADITLAGTPAGGTFSGTGVTGNLFDPSAGTQTITYSYTDLNGCSASATSSITINPLPVVSAGTYGPVCIDAADITLAGTPAGGTFSGTGVTGNLFDPSAGTQTITYSYTDLNGCSASATTSITVNPLPVVSAGTYGPVCIDAADITLAGTPAGGTFSGTGVTGNLFDPSVGTQTITYSYTDANGCSASATTSITVNPLPIVSAGTYGPVCIDAADITLAGTPAGGTFSGTGVTGNLFDPSVGTQTITYSYTDANGCSASATTSITVNPLPIVSAGTYGPVCIDAADITLAGTPAGGTFSGTGVTGNLFDPSVGTQTITYSYTDLNGCSASATTSITVNPLPIVSAGTYGPVCIDAADITLAGTPAGGTFSGTGVTGNLFDPSVGTQTITYSYTDANGCSASATTSITVNPLPIVSAGTYGPVCIDAADITLAGTPAGGTFSGTGVTGNLFDPSVGTQTITYSYTDLNGCSASATTSITVNPLPIVSAGTYGPVCIDAADITLSGTPAGGTFSGTGVTGNLFDPSAGTQTITYSYTDLNGCSASATTSITVNPLPVVSAGTYGPVCIDAADITLSGTPAGGTFSGTGVTGNLFDPSAGTQTITYSYTDLNGCSASATTSITVNPLPVVSAGTYGPVCIDAADITLAGTPAGGTFSGTGVTGNLFDPSAGTQTITYSYTDLNGCSASATTSITVNPLPVVSAGTYGPVCIDAADITLSGTPAGGTFSGTGVTGNLFDPSAGTQTITYSYTDLNGCSASATTSITVNPLPVVSAGTYGPVCIDAADITLSGTPAGGTFSGTGVTGNLFDPSAGTQTITYSYSDLNGCSASATTSITVNPLPVVSAGTYGPVCIDAADITLSGTPAGGTFSGTGVTGNLFDPSAGTQTITYSYTDLNGCSASATTSITVNPLPVVSAGTYGPVCIDAADITLSGTPAGGTFSGTGVTGNLFDPSAGTQTITYSYTDLNGCSTSATTSITVNPLPTASVAGTATICSGATAVNYTFIGTPDVIVTYSLDGGTTTTTITLDGTGSATLPASNTATSTVTLISVENTTTTCEQAITGTATVTVNPFPTLATVNAAPVCEGNSTNVVLTGLLPSVAGVATYTLSSTGTTEYTESGTADASGEFSFTTPVLTLAENGLVVTVTKLKVDGTNCEKTFSGKSTTLVVNPNPTLGTVSSLPVCEGTAAVVKLTGLLPSVAGVATYTLSSTGTTEYTESGTADASGEFSFTTPVLTLAENGLVVTVTKLKVDGTNCEKTFTGKSTTLVVNPNPTLGTVSSLPVCEGTAAVVKLTGLLPSVAGVATYTLSSTGTTEYTESGTADASGEFSFTTPVLTLAENGLVVTVTKLKVDGTNCEKTFSGKSTTLVVNPNPTLGTVSSLPVCEGTAAVVKLTGLLPSVAGVATYTLSSTGTTEYTESGTADASGEFSFTTPVLTLAENGLVVTVTKLKVDGTNCEKTFTGKSTTLVVNPNPTLGTVSSLPVCEGTAAVVKLTGLLPSVAGVATYTLSSTGTTEYTESGTADASGEFSFTTPVLTLAENGLVVTVTKLKVDGTNCEKTFTGKSTTLVVNPNPTLGTVSSLPVCEGTAAVVKLTGLLPSVAGVATYTLSSTGTTEYTESGTADASGEFSFTTPVLTLAENGLVVTVTKLKVDGTNCEKTFTGKSTTLVVNPNPTLGTVSSLPVCEGTAAVVKLTGLLPSVAGVATYTLSSTGTTEYTESGTADASGEFSFTTPVLTLAENGLVVTVTKLKVDGTNCEKTFTGKSTTLVVNPNPTLGTVSSLPVCEGTAAVVKLTGLLPSVAGVATYTLSSTGTTEYTESGTADASGEFSFTTPVLTLAENGLVVTVTKLKVDGTNCEKTFTGKSTTLVVNPNPTLGTVSSLPVCEGTAAVVKLTGLLPSVAGVATYTLSSTGTTEYTESGTADASGEFSFTTPVLTLAENGLVVTVTKLKVDGTNCEKTFTGKSTTLVVNPNPECLISGPDSPICPGAETTYSAPMNMANYKWTIVGNGTIKDNIDNQQSVIVIAGSVCGSEYSLKLEITSIADCKSTCEVVRMVNDIIPPSIANLPADMDPQTLGIQVVEPTGDGATKCEAKVTWIEPTADDNCTIKSLTYVTSPIGLVNGGIFPVGITTITYTAEDKCGNKTTSSFDVVVEDNTAPVITNCPTADVTAATTSTATTCEALVQLPTITVKDNCTDEAAILINWEISGATSATGTGALASYTFPVGTSTVYTTYEDASGNSIDCEYNVVVTDGTNPTITCPAPATFEGCSTAAIAGLAYSETPITVTDLIAAGVSATDNCEVKSVTYQDASSGTCPIVVSRTWTVTDAAGNVASCTQTITIDDTKAPTWTTIDGTLDREVECNDATGLIAAQALFPVASDLCDMDVTNIVKSTGTFTPNLVNCTTTGTYTNTWTVTDACGNTSTTFTQTIKIIDSVKPTIVLPASFIDANPAVPIVNDNVDFNTPASSCALNVVFVKPTFSDNCTATNSLTTTVTAKDKDGNPITVFNQVTTYSADFPLGVNTLTFEVSDNCGNSTSKTITVTVKDNVKPRKPTLQPITACGVVVPPTTIDNCSGLITGTTTDPTEYYINGTYTITWLFTDESGNTETATQTVTVTGSGAIAGSVLKDITAADNLVNGALQTSVVAHVSLVKGSTIVATVPVTAGLYTLPDVCAGIYNVVLHTTATGSTSPQLPAGYSGFVGEGKLNGAPDVSPNGVAQVTISSGTLVYGNARVAAGGDLSFGLGPQALPVRLISFEGKPTDKGNVLTWKSSAEQNFSHYEVERSTDAKAFVNIGKVATTNGNSKETNSYQYLDAASGMLPGAVTNYTNDSYYRLKMVDLDGSSEYSKVIFIKTEKIGNSTVGQFYPNPASSNETSVEINSATNSAWQITTLDLAGRVLSTEYRNLEMGRNLVKLSTEKLSPGTNIIRFENNNGVQYRKLIKN